VVLSDDDRFEVGVAYAAVFGQFSLPPETVWLAYKKGQLDVIGATHTA
jgi:hypothetical protein